LELTRIFKLPVQIALLKACVKITYRRNCSGIWPLDRRYNEFCARLHRKQISAIMESKVRNSADKIKAAPVESNPHLYVLLYTIILSFIVSFTCVFPGTFSSLILISYYQFCLLFIIMFQIITTSMESCNQPLDSFPIFFVSRMFITVFTRALHLHLS
jgi:hypothetical protein